MKIYVQVPFHAHRIRLRRADSDTQLANEVGEVNVDHAFVGFIDYESFLAAVKKDFESCEEWTITELDDALSINFSGEIASRGEKLVYVKSVDGDGAFPVLELVEDGQPVGLECVLVGHE